MAGAQENIVREVWAQNLPDELRTMLNSRQFFRYVAVDTEFPGFLRHSPRFASAEDRYRDVKHNVDAMKLIQLGLTFFGGTGGLRRCVTWQINFREFDVSSPSTDARWEPSVELPKRSGLDLERFRREGVDAKVLSGLLLSSGWVGAAARSGRRPSWVTFQGLYDVAYLVKLITQSPLPETLSGFVQLVGETLGSVFDVKYMAGFCSGLHGGRLGLVQLSKILQVEAEEGTGAAAHHQAGYDSLLTAMAFEKIMEKFHLPEDALAGVLWGIEQEKIVRPRKEEVAPVPMASPTIRAYLPRFRCYQPLYGLAGFPVPVMAASTLPCAFVVRPANPYRV